MQRREPGEHREDDAQPRMAGAPGDQERKPRGLHAGDIAASAPATTAAHPATPRRGNAARARAQSRAGMHQQRRAERFQASEQPDATARDRIDARERARGKRQPDAAARERAIDVVGIQRGRARSLPTRRTAPPATARRRGRRRAADSPARAGATRSPSGLDRHSSARSSPSRSTSATRACRGLAVEIDHVRALARQIQHGQSVLAAHERQLAASRQRPHERLGPQVLVYVDLHQLSDPVCGD